MESVEIKVELLRRGITQVEIAAELGVAQGTVSRVISKKDVSDRIMRVVAEKIGKQPEEVFPEYYLRPPKRSWERKAAV